MPTILIDADGCPVVDLTVRIGRSHGVPVKILCDTAHRIEREGAETLVFDKGADSVDFALVNRITPGDIVITQDYGLATMCLARRARVLNQNGLEYTAQNIDSLLARRHENKKLLRAGKHPKGPAKRTKEQDEAFAKALESMLKKRINPNKAPISSVTIPFPGQLHTRWWSHRQTRPEWHLPFRSSDNPDCSKSCSVRRPSAYRSRA